MMCAWKELKAVLPLRLREPLEKYRTNEPEELRLRANGPPELVCKRNCIWLEDRVSEDDLNYVINAASRYSPWNAATCAQGYLTAPGGHRIGICGEVVCKDGFAAGFRKVSSICIRIAKDYIGIAGNLRLPDGSTLVIGAPGWGKTTLLRDLIRKISDHETVCVVDERGELFPVGFPQGKRMDVLTGCPKPAGIDMALRTMGPKYIALDEITAESDCQAILQAANCGVRLLATAHGVSLEDLRRRKIYRPLLENCVFQRLLVLHSNKAYTEERMSL